MERLISFIKTVNQNNYRLTKEDLYNAKYIETEDGNINVAHYLWDINRQLNEYVLSKPGYDRSVVIYKTDYTIINRTGKTVYIRDKDNNIKKYLSEDSIEFQETEYRTIPINNIQVDINDLKVINLPPYNESVFYIVNEEIQKNIQRKDLLILDKQTEYLKLPEGIHVYSKLISNIISIRQES